VSEPPDLFDDVARLPEDDLPDLLDPSADDDVHDSSALRTMACPPLGVLIVYADTSDLSITERRRARIREHVRCCDVCQRHLEKLDEEMLQDVADILLDSFKFNEEVLRARDQRWERGLKEQCLQMGEKPRAYRTMPSRLVVFGEATTDSTIGSGPGAASAVTSGSASGSTSESSSRSPQTERLDCHERYPRPLRRWLAVAATITVIGGGLFVRPSSVILHAEELILRAIEAIRQTITGAAPRSSVEASAIAPAAQATAADSVTASAGVTSGAGTFASSANSRPPAISSFEPPTAPPGPRLSRWLARNFAGSTSAARRSFLPTIERRASLVRQHLIFLQRLARHQANAKPTKDDGVDARRRIEAEYQSLNTHLRVLEQHLNVLVGTGTRSAELRAPPPDDWERRASEALPHATRLEQRLKRLFARDDLPPEEARGATPGSVRDAFELLWESIHGKGPS
jgi:hypothetical protein